MFFRITILLHHLHTCMCFVVHVQDTRSFISHYSTQDVYHEIVNLGQGELKQQQQHGDDNESTSPRPAVLGLPSDYSSIPDVVVETAVSDFMLFCRVPFCPFPSHVSRDYPGAAAKQNVSAWCLF